MLLDTKQNKKKVAKLDKCAQWGQAVGTGHPSELAVSKFGFSFI